MTELTVALSWVESQHPATVGPLSHSVILTINLFLNNRVISHTIYFTFGTLKPNDVHFDILIKIKVIQSQKSHVGESRANYKLVPYH